MPSPALQRKSSSRVSVKKEREKSSIKEDEMFLDDFEIEVGKPLKAQNTDDVVDDLERELGTLEQP